MTHEVLVSILQFPENLGVIQEALARVVFLDLEMDLECASGHLGHARRLVKDGGDEVEA